MDLQKILYYSQEAYWWADNSNDIIQKIVTIQLQELVGYVNSINCKEKLHKVNILEEKIEEKMKIYLSTYNEEELAIALLNLKACFRTGISSPKIEQDDYEEANRHSEILWVLSVLLKIEKYEFKNRSLIYESKNLALVFRLAYYFNVLKDNKEWYEYLLKINENTDFNDINCFLKEAYFYSEEYNSYMDDMLVISNNDIPEEMEIENEELRKFLYKNGLHKNNILENISNIFLEDLKFSIEDINHFCYYGLREKVDLHNIRLEDYINIKVKNEHYKELEEKLSINKYGYENIIKMFSLNRIDKNKLGNNKYIELRSIYEIGDKIIYNPIDMGFNISCLEKFSIRKHFEHYYLYNFNEVESSIQQKLNKNANRISTYLCYVLVEILYKNGYKVPVNDSIPMAEINSIIIKKDGQTTNLLKTKKKNYGDIDILALNDKKNEILNIEFKYFAPLMELESLNDKFKESDRKKYMLKALEREKIIKENMKEVIQFLNGNEEKKYKIRTIFVSTRPDYWYRNSDDVEYIPWIDFIGKIKTKRL